MTEQFDTFANPSPVSKHTYPLLVCLQSPLFGAAAQQIVAPLALTRFFPANSRLTPTVRIDDGDYVVLVPSLTTISVKDLQRRVANLAKHRDELLGAVDLIFYGV